MNSLLYPSETAPFVHPEFVHAAMRKARKTLLSGQPGKMLYEYEGVTDGWTVSGRDHSFFINFPALRRDSHAAWAASPFAAAFQIIGNDQTPSRIVATAYYGEGAEKIGASIQIHFHGETGAVVKVERSIDRWLRTQEGGCMETLIGMEYDLNSNELEEGDRAFLLEIFPRFMRE